MADIKPYERYKKDKRNQPKKHNIDNYTDFQKALLRAEKNIRHPKNLSNGSLVKIKMM